MSTKSQFEQVTVLEPTSVQEGSAVIASFLLCPVAGIGVVLTTFPQSLQVTVVEPSTVQVASTVVVVVLMCEQEDSLEVSIHLYITIFCCALE